MYFRNVKHIFIVVSLLVIEFIGVVSCSSGESNNSNNNLSRYLLTGKEINQVIGKGTNLLGTKFVSESSKNTQIYTEKPSPEFIPKGTCQQPYNVQKFFIMSPPPEGYRAQNVLGENNTKEVKSINVYQTVLLFDNVDTAKDDYKLFKQNLIKCFASDPKNETFPSDTYDLLQWKLVRNQNQVSYQGIKLVDKHLVFSSVEANTNINNNRNSNLNYRLVNRIILNKQSEGNN